MEVIQHKEMKEFLRKLFNVYPGEETKAILFALLGFLWAFGVTGGLKFADALFLLHVGPASLPTTYQLVSCGIIILATIMLYAFNRIAIHRIFITALSVGVIFYLFAYVCLINNIGVESKWIWFTLRVFGSLFFTIICTCFWTFLDHYYPLQDAKRLYSLFSSSVFIGVACTGIVMNSGLIPFQQMIFIIIAICILTISLIIHITKKLTLLHDDNEGLGAHSQSSLTWTQQLKLVFTSRFTLLLMTGNFLTYVLMVLTEYNYMSSFDAVFDPGTIMATGEEQNAALTKFLGKCLAVVSITNLLFGLFVYSRLIKRFGIGSLVICTPLILVITFSGWSLSPTLIFPIMGLFVVEGTLYVVDDNNFNLLLNAVPSKLKYKIRLIIESFFEPVGMLVSSFLLSQNLIDSRLLGLVLAVTLLCVVLMMKANYLKGIYSNLMENAVHFKYKVTDWIAAVGGKERQTIEKRLLAAVRQSNEMIAPLAVEWLCAVDDEQSTIKMLKQAEHADTSIKICCVDSLIRSHYPASPVICEHLHHWLAVDSDVHLRGAIHFYLAKQHKLSDIDIAADLNSDIPMLKGAAILALTPSNVCFINHPATAFYLKQMLNSNSEDNICIAIKVLANSSFAADLASTLPYLSHSSPRIVQTAVTTLSFTDYPNTSEFVSPLIALLKSSTDNTIRLYTLRALNRHVTPELAKELIISSIHFRPNERRQIEEIVTTIGPAMTPILLALTQDNAQHDRCRILASKILGRLDPVLLRNNLYELISSEVERARFYLYYGTTLNSEILGRDHAILRNTLLSNYYSVLDLIIHLLASAGELENCEQLSRFLRSPHAKMRSQVLEALERTCELKIFRLITPLLFEESKTIVYSYESKNKILTPQELLSYLCHSTAPTDYIVGSALKHRLAYQGLSAK